MNVAALLEACRAKGITLACAESCTGGMLGAALTMIPGASDIFQAGFITYSNGAKMALLGVKSETLSAFGAVSEQVAIEMAVGCEMRCDANLAISITGVAGPGGSERKPEGRVCFAISYRGQSRAETVEFGALGRENVRNAARDHALEMLISAVEIA